MTETKRKAEDIDRAIGIAVRTARNELGMSQDALGKKLGVTFQQIQKYEKGANRISSSMLVQVARVLQRPTTYFLDEPKYKPNTRGEQMAEFVASKDGQRLIDLAMEMPAQHLDGLLSVARALSAAGKEVA
jgi:transcriptional regulator with XRE-family HTH domain